jgi:hypothetical protein
MIKKVLVILIYLVDYLAGRSFYYVAYFIGKSRKLISSAGKRIIILVNPGNGLMLLELQHLREELMRLRFANRVMRQELNRATQKRPCLCKKL